MRKKLSTVKSGPAVRKESGQARKKTAVPAVQRAFEPGLEWATIQCRQVPDAKKEDVLDPVDSPSRELTLGGFDRGVSWPGKGISEIALPPSPYLRVSRSSDAEFETTESASSAGLAIALLRHDLPDQPPLIGTAWVVGPRTFVTAAHNVVTIGTGQTSAINLALSYDGTTVHGGWHAPSRLRVPCDWIKWPHEDNLVDFAIIVIRDPLPSAVRSCFGFGNYLNKQLDGLRVNTIGYPGAGVRDYSMKYSVGRLSNPSLWEVPYSAPAGEGLSGAPVYAKKGDVRIAVGIHRGVKGRANIAVRINGGVWQEIQKFVDNPDRKD